MNSSDTIRSIEELKGKLGSNLLLLAHYYQDDNIFKLAHITGDSYQLAVHGGSSRARTIVMCGVLFMAETIRLLTSSKQRVFIPEKAAGCPMAEMIDETSYREAFLNITKATGRKPIPLLYVNSTVEVKSAVGLDDGVCCTSSNAMQILKTLLSQGNSVFFLPDKNLAENSAIKLGLAPEDFALIRPGMTPDQIPPKAKIFAWNGFCIVHERVSECDVLAARRKFPKCKIIVHPECGMQIVEMCDYAGSTKQLLDYFNTLPSGATLVVGTEFQFVERLKRLRKDITVHHLSEASICRNMAKVTPEKLERCLRAIARGDEEELKEFEVLLPEEQCAGARAALERMIRIAGK